MAVPGTPVVSGPFALAAGATAAVGLRLRDAARLRRYREYQDFYEGRHFLRPRNGRTNLVLNYARAIVDKGIAYLLGRGIGWSVASRQDSDRSKRRAGGVEQVLYDVGFENDVAAVDHHVAQNAAVLGDGVYKVFWDVAEQRVRIVSIDPRTWFATFAGDDPSVLRRVECCYQLRAEDLAAGGYGLTMGEAEALAPNDRLVDVVERWTPAELEILVHQKTVRQGANPYGLIPFVHVPNLPLANEAWGRSDLVDVIPVNRELNERVSDQSDVIRFHADPPIVFKGVTDHNDVAVGPGSVWDLPADADVSLLEWRGQGIEVAGHLDRLQQALFEVSETPKTAFGDGAQHVTGVALEIQLRPIIQKTYRRRLFWERALRQRSGLVLRLLERFDPSAVPAGAGAYTVRVVWPPMLPKDDAVEVANEVALVTAGLRSARSAMDTLGTENPEEELQRVVEDRATLAAPVAPAAATDTQPAAEGNVG